jgi:hypothetical protein
MFSTKTPGVLAVGIKRSSNLPSQRFLLLTENGGAIFAARCSSGCIFENLSFIAEEALCQSHLPPEMVPLTGVGLQHLGRIIPAQPVPAKAGGRESTVRTKGRFVSPEWNAYPVYGAAVEAVAGKLSTAGGQYGSEP